MINIFKLIGINVLNLKKVMWCQIISKTEKHKKLMCFIRLISQKTIKSLISYI